MIEIGPLRPEDRDPWEVLARGYKTFYRESEPDEAYELTWRRLAAGRVGKSPDGQLDVVPELAVAVKSDVKTGHDIAYVTRSHAS